MPALRPVLHQHVPIVVRVNGSCDLLGKKAAFFTLTDFLPSAAQSALPRVLQCEAVNMLVNSELFLKQERQEMPVLECVEGEEMRYAWVCGKGVMDRDWELFVAREFQEESGESRRQGQVE